MPLRVRGCVQDLTVKVLVYPDENAKDAVTLTKGDVQRLMCTLRTRVPPALHPCLISFCVSPPSHARLLCVSHAMSHARLLCLVLVCYVSCSSAMCVIKRPVNQTPGVGQRDCERSHLHTFSQTTHFHQHISTKIHTHSKTTSYTTHCHKQYSANTSNHVSSSHPSIQTP